VIGLGDQKSGAHAVGQAPKMPLRLQRAPKGTEAVDEILRLDIEVVGFDFKSREKPALERIGELVELDEVATVTCDIVGNFCDDARLIGAAEFED
jgi:hypothetical protein